MTFSANRALVNSVTLCGLLLGCAGVAAWPRHIALACLSLSVLADAIDGRLSRHLACATHSGALLDWWVDIAIGNALAVSLSLRGLPWLGVPSIAIMLACQIASSVWGGYGIRTSGRTWVTVIAIAGAL